MEIFDPKQIRKLCYVYIWYFEISKKDFCEKAKVPSNFFDSLDNLDKEVICDNMPQIIRMIMELPYDMPNEYKYLY